jgi:uncharacterized membrane protein (UPF0182 family)
VSGAATLPAPVREAPEEHVSLWRVPRSRSLLLLTVVGIVVGVVALAARIYTDALWYAEIDQVDVFWKTLTWKVLATAVVGLGTACFLLLNLGAVERAMARVAPPDDDGGLAAQLWRNRRLLKPGLAVSCGVVALELRPRDSWQLLLVWTQRSGFGVEDPLFHRDAGFFVFSLPLYEEIVRWLLETVAMAGVASVAAYAAAGAFRTGRRRVAMRAARRHLLMLAAALLVIVAWRFRLEQYALALPHDPVGPGATYTDVTVRLPTLKALFYLSLGGAGVCLYACVGRVPVVAAGVLGLAAVLAFVLKADLPAAVHRFTVEPQALSRERPHVAHGIEFTRHAYGLDRVRVAPLPAGSELSRRDIARARETVDNVPLWDESVLRPAMNELQSIGRYYRFPSVSVDRYEVGGKPAVMSVGARQLSLRRLGAGDRSWANDRFAYTHGYGVVAVHGGDTDQGRYPRFAQQNFRTRANPLGIREPRVYYGEQAGADPPYVILNTRRAEVDEPISGDRTPEYHYDGDGGIPIADPLRRLAFAARFRDLDLLLSETVTDQSRILLHRNVADRLRTVAPFLRWDDHPQTAVIDGRVQFLFDGYTTSASYPYSAAVRMGRDKVNYVRAAVRATVDAFTGDVRIYADVGDPILRAWEAVYPSLFRPASQMPEELLAHLRYPQKLFEAQAAAYETYHADDATAFWNGSDAWARALQLAGPAEQAGEIHFPDPHQKVDADQRGGRKVAPRRWRMEPAYGLARLPGDTRERFMVTTPFTPRGRENLVAYLAGSLDAQGRPELTQLSLPRDRLTVGPTQATRRILSSSGVVQRLQLLNRESRDLGTSGVSRTVLGAPRVVPIAGTLVYVQPLFLTAGGDGVPRLQLVTVVANGRVGYGRDLATALRRSVERSSGT